jgi:hypothetical protein
VSISWSKIDDILGHKISLYKYKDIKIISFILYHNEINYESRARETIWTHGRSKNTLLNG